MDDLAPYTVELGADLSTEALDHSLAQSASVKLEAGAADDERPGRPDPARAPPHLGDAALAQGADPKAIQNQMRHSTISVTFDVYGHLFPGHLISVLDRLDDDHRQAVEQWRRAGDPGR